MVYSVGPVRRGMTMTTPQRAKTDSRLLNGHQTPMSVEFVGLHPRHLSSFAAAGPCFYGFKLRRLKTVGAARVGSLYTPLSSETLTNGWWGIGLFIAIPALIANWFAARSLGGQLRPAYRDLTVLSVSPSPMPPMERLAKDPMTWIAPATATLIAMVVALFAAVMVSAPSPVTASQPGQKPQGAPTPSYAEPTHGDPTFSPYAPAPSSMAKYCDLPTSTPTPATKNYMDTCWTEPDENENTREVPCGSDLAYFQVVSVTKDNSGCGETGYLTLAETGYFASVEQK